MIPARWKRTVIRLRALAEDLKAHDFQVIEPDNLETPPDRRHGRPMQEPAPEL
jgi:hypothetical protein